MYKCKKRSEFSLRLAEATTRSQNELINILLDFIIENNGSIEQLEAMAESFVDGAIKEDTTIPIGSHVLFSDNTSPQIVFDCSKF